MGSQSPASMATTATSAFLLLTTLACLQIAATKIEGTTSQPNKQQTLSWFIASGQTDNCTSVPADIVAGALDDSICKGAVPGVPLCACVSTVPTVAKGASTYPKYMRMCGTCFDPCALHFHVEHNDVATFEATNGL